MLRQGTGGRPDAFAWDAGKQEARTTDADGVVVYDGYRGNVLIYSQRGNGDTDNHRYDRRLNRSLVVNGSQGQHEARFDPRGNPTVGLAPQPLRFSKKTKYDERNNPIEFVDERGQRLEEHATTSSTSWSETATPKSTGSDSATTSAGCS